MSTPEEEPPTLKLSAELERLAGLVHDRFGRDAWQAAIQRALDRLSSSEPTSVALSPDQLRGRLVISAADGRQWTIEALYDALVIELEELTRQA